MSGNINGFLYRSASWKRGFVIIYVLLLMTPVMLILMYLLDLTFMDFRTSVNVIEKQQCYYNTEAGAVDALKRYKYLSYDSSQTSVYYLDLSGEYVVVSLISPDNSNYVRVRVKYIVLGTQRNYSIVSTGYYNKCMYIITKEFTEG